MFNLFLVASLLLAQSASLQWLSRDISPVRGIRQEIIGYSDLEPLATRLAGVQIVMLGEESHGDGATFEAKGRLIRFLHERLGFEVLAWESGFLECEGMNAGGNPKLALPNVWSESAQVKPLFDYIVSTRKTEHPLVQTGIDIQSYNHRWISRITPFETPEEQTLIRDWFAAGQHETGRSEIKSVLEGIAKRISVSKDADSELLAQALRDLIAFDFRPVDASSDYRDRHMGGNLVWLATVRYPGKKIIVWAANFHIARQIEPNFISMGDVAFQALGKRVYGIGFTAYGGSVGSQSRNEFRTLPAPPANSLEAMLHTAGKPFAFLDLRGLPAKHRLREPLDAWPVRYEVMHLDWSARFDGIFFIDKMTPSTF